MAQTSWHVIGSELLVGKFFLTYGHRRGILPNVEREMYYLLSVYRGGPRGGGCGPPPPEMKLPSSYSLLKFVYLSDVTPQRCTPPKKNPSLDPPLV